MTASCRARTFFNRLTPRRAGPKLREKVLRNSSLASQVVGIALSDMLSNLVSLSSR
jgi:hypothetical protein